jgi:Mg2+-importing ATPase
LLIVGAGSVATANSFPTENMPSATTLAPEMPDPVAVHGLSSEEVAERSIRYGANNPSPQVGNRFSEVWRALLNPLTLILLFAGGLSAFLGEFVGASIIVVIVTVGISLDLAQTRRSQLAVARLRREVAPTATVLRDGIWREIDRRDVVPDDVIRLAAGDLVPADAELLEANDLHLQQAALTGESMPVEKTPLREGATDGKGAPRENRVFLGTSVVSGTATAVVRATGRATMFADIASRTTGRAPETEFERGTRRFGTFILELAVFLVLFVFVIKIVLKHDPFESLLFAVAIAVGITPEFLPMILTVTLGEGARRMARRKVIVKHLAAIQNLGSVDILCSDKTGTLTAGKMKVERVLDPWGQESDRVLLPAYLNSLYETGIKSPLDAAILNYATPDVGIFEKRDEVPFDFERRRLSVVVDTPEGPLLITKGAPESVLAIAAGVEIDGVTHSLDDAGRDRCRQVYEGLGTDGLRALAVAVRRVPEQSAYRADDERDLTLIGFLAFSDPPLPGVATVIRTLRHDGVQIKILSGDGELVVRHVCDSLGLDTASTVLGTDIDRMSDAALGHVAEQTTVFARLSPSHKNRVITALKRRGHVVGFLGDGINDAPSLHVADVGISVASAVDVAKEAADIVLLERSLAALHSGIIEGRMAFGNVTKYLLMGTSSNFGNMLSMALASLFLPFLPMLPPQILLNNFLYDLAQVAIPTDQVDRPFIIKPRRWDVAFVRRFMFSVGPISSLFDLLTFWVLLAWFHRSEPLFQTGWFVESLATQTLVLFVIRTGGSVFRSRPSRPLAFGIVSIALLGAVLPYTGFGSLLGFVPLPASYFLFLVVVVTAYLFAVETVKRYLFRTFFA